MSEAGKSKQIQKSGDSSLNIQAEQITITKGLSYEEAKSIALDVFKSNFYQLSGIAKDIAQKRAEEITNTFLDELLKDVGKSDTPKHLVEVRIYHHSIVETDLSIHIYWESEPGSQHKSSLGLKLSYALKDLGLLNHSVWVETAALEVPLSSGNFRTRDIPAPDTKNNAVQTGPNISDKEGF